MNSHAQVPTALVTEDRVRVYFASRPQQSQSLTTFVDLDRSDISRVLYVHDRPVLSLGAPGTFDADGVMPSAILHVGSEIWLYYSGWSRLGGEAPYNNATGLAISRDGGFTFERAFQGPILDRAPREPWSATSPAVVRDGDNWHMWYSSGTGWHRVHDKIEHTYVLKHAISNDGRFWYRDGVPTIKTDRMDESQTRPAIIQKGARWHMWFSYRGSNQFRTTGDTYRIGYATSTDLTSWKRGDEEAGITPSDDGWDSQMICYPNVVLVNGTYVMFYNGNDFGRWGFGAAVLM